MSNDELFQAMRYGSKNSQEDRGENDLGRFGLGLKLASLSLCRILTVVSKKNGEIAGMRWNLNNISENDWMLEELSDTEINNVHNISKLKNNNTGTLVVWEDFDILKKISGGKIYNELSEKLSNSIFHISLVYHRFLSNPNNLLIFINNKLIEPKDPFLPENKKTRVLRPPEEIMVVDNNDVQRKILVEAIVLPFQSDLSPSDIEKLGGIDKIKTMQGFYIYRNNRLIIWATWFRMKPESELTKYARIKVDIPSTLDSIWQIDIKKANAMLPSVVRNNLVSYVEEAMKSSMRKSTHRTVLKDREVDHLWETREDRDKKLAFKVNKSSYIFQDLKNKVSEKDLEYFEEFLDYLEKSIPYQDLYVAVANGNISSEIDEYEKDRLLVGAKKYFQFYKSISPELEAKKIIDKVCSIEPFSKYGFLREQLEGFYGKL